MKWYNKYLTVFEKPFDSVSPEIIAEIKQKVEAKQSDKPLVSVVMIAHNEETRLLSCLWSLCDNICEYPIEIIAVDNNSTDRTTEVFESVGITPYLEKKKGPGHARQCGSEHTKGKYYVCIDSDTMYPKKYIQTMIDAMEKKNHVASFGLWSFMPDKKRSAFGLMLYEALRDMHIYIQSLKRPELSVRGMSFAYRADYGREIGYKVNIRRGEDGSMLLGLKKYGKIKFISSNKARVVTAANTLDSDGSLFQNIKKKAKESFRKLPYFKKKAKYDDLPSNLI